MNQLSTGAEFSVFGHCIPRTHNELPDIEQRISGIEQRAFIPLLRSLFLRGLLHLPHLGIPAISAQQIVMRPELEHAALIQDADFVDLHQGGTAMREDQVCAKARILSQSEIRKSVG